MRDRYGREINYLRISVTDLCNLRCSYCMPEEKEAKFDQVEPVSLEEIFEISRVLVGLGVDKIRLTGGEPLVRKGILDLVKGLGSLGLRDFSLTSNGILLKDYAESLKDNGLDRVNISLDSLDPDKYRRISRGGRLEDVLESIKVCQALGLTPIKLNVVLIKGFNDDEIGDFVDLTQEEDLDVRFIELMPIGQAISMEDSYMSTSVLLEKRPDLRPVSSEDPSSPANYYQLPQANGRVGLINPVSCKFCENCNRIRLTSQGRLKPCLHSDEEYDLLEPLKRGSLREEIEDIIGLKPEEHNLEKEKFVYKNMYEIGG